MTKSARPSSIPADPTQWSEKSKQSVAFGFRREYEDIPYKCWHCQADCIFTAQDQKYTFEVKKASIDQRRSLCAECWSESHRLRAALRDCEEQWAAAKENLKIDKVFLHRWLELLTALEAYVPYKPDTARKIMLGKFLANA
jgi:Probable zinc-ribbon domain